MGVRGTGLVATLAAIWFALAAVQSVQAASVADSILVGGYARPVLIDPSTGKVRKLPAFNAARDETALRTTDGRALITAYRRRGGLGGALLPHGRQGRGDRAIRGQRL